MECFDFTLSYDNYTSCVVNMWEIIEMCFRKKAFGLINTLFCDISILVSFDDS